MSGSFILDVISTVTVIAGVVFAMVQVRNFRLARQRESAFELFRTLQTRMFAAGIDLVISLPDGLDDEGLKQHLSGKMDLLYALLTTFENIGILVYRGELDLELVDDYLSGFIVITWRKTRAHIRAVRREQARDTFAEWVEWLYDRIAERETTAAPVPAYIAHRSWQPPGRSLRRPTV